MLRDNDANTSVKQYRAPLLAGGGPVALMANNPLRNYLYVSNIGLNSGSFWFEDAVNSGQGQSLGPGEYREFLKAPINSMSMQSTLGTTFVVIEGLFSPERRV